jgi:diacylglycerol kinase family enzyme
MQTLIIINERAGTVVGGDVEAIAEGVTQRFVAAGHEVACEIVKPTGLEEAFTRLRKEPPEVLIVGGGDGTVRCAATALVGTPTTLGVLPLGTVNRLARDLTIPLDIDQAADALARGRVTAIDVAEVNGRLFLCNAILGPTTRFSTERQKLRGKPALERMRGYFKAVRDVLRRRRRTNMSIDDGTGTLHIRVLSLVVTNNPYSDEACLTLRRPELDAGALAVYAARHTSGWGVAAAGVRAALGRLAGDPNVLRLHAQHLMIDISKRASIAVSIDGEVEELRTPLAFKIRPKALSVLAPAYNAGESACTDSG